ncbi:MAG: sulfite exporter TauE/SafE family protein [Lacisediminihabitans sp.]
MHEALAITLITLVSAIAAMAQSATGSGYGIVAAPLLFIVDPRTVPGPLLVSTLLVMVVVIAQHRRFLSLRELKPAFLWTAPGIAGGFLVEAVNPPAVSMLAVGVIVLLGVAVTVRGVHIPSSRAALGIAGVLAGAFTVLAATPGPPMAIVYRPDDTNRLRANLSAFFFLVVFVTLVPLIATGAHGWAPASHTVALCTGVLLGVLLVRPFLRLLSARVIRAGALGLCALAGVVVLVKAVLALAA